MKKENNELYEQVKSVFNSFLEKKKLRKTTERADILQEIYSKGGHFDVETLYARLKKKGSHVSRATVYNTMELLIESSLVKKHQFTQSQAIYEKSFGFNQHDHIICINCNKVVEFCDPRIQTIQKTVGDLLHFEVMHHSLILYGTCTNVNCENKKKRTT